MPLTGDAILAADDLVIEEVDVREWWGDTVFVRGLTAIEKDAFEAESLDLTRKGDPRPVFANMRARLCARCICDAQGARLFTDDQARALGEKSAAALDKIANVAQRLSGLTKRDLDELVKNSEGAPTVSSRSS